jgi:hypothetical protein
VVRLTTQLLPSRLLLSGNRTPPVSSCVPLSLQMLDSSGGVSGTAPSIWVDLSTTAGALFADSGCLQSAKAIALDGGAPQAAVYFQSHAPGEAVVAAKAGDLLEGRLSLFVGGATLAVSPAKASAKPGRELQFSVQGGQEPYQWRVEQNGSGATISSAGLYRAGERSGLDVVRVVDAKALGGFAPVEVVAVKLELGLDEESPLPFGGELSGSLELENQSAFRVSGARLWLFGKKLALEPLQGEGLLEECAAHCYGLGSLGQGERRRFLLRGGLLGAPGQQAEIDVRVEIDGDEVAQRTLAVQIEPVRTKVGCGQAPGALGLGLGGVLAFLLVWAFPKPNEAG